MTRDDIKALIDELDGVLDKERIAILSGDLDGLNRLAEAKTGLVHSINEIARPTESLLLALHDKLERNQELLTSAMRGVRSVADRLAELRSVRDGLHTYDASGHKTRFQSARTGTVEKRA